MTETSNRTSSPEIVVADRDMTLYCGDCLAVMRDFSDRAFQACVTSPPYLDARPEYPSITHEHRAAILRELRRVVHGPLLVNVGRLWRNRCEEMWWVDLIHDAVSAGWELRDTLVWIKPNANPIHGQVFANSHEYVFVFGDGAVPDNIRTEYDAESLARFTRRYRNGGGVKGDYREQENREANELGARARSFFIGYVGKDKGNPHPAPMPLELAMHLVSLACIEGEEIIDPFAGSGTTLIASRLLGRASVGVEIMPDYAALAASRLAQQSLLAEAL